MPKLTLLLCTTTFLALGLAAPAAAAPSGTGSAEDTVRELESRGYHVQVNSNAKTSLSLCKVTGVHGLADSNINDTGHRIDPSQHTTVYVNVSCQPDG
ncbi:hypothetical protein BTO20_04195 [Mycobacterium dioxanotrophicus]|jgi:hypothetical protein|uniref:PASTA domain-containing protein n=1 Tax=Mycobacterium dioxanotrophicus TaxID=482462 RepID=A0A1Y0BYD6_9MYCO|nr:hypothetical protein [Mycobacterium dioxanotrophicus]ART67896.1 hypothetical protein BTO20_04195 [Mycobacterium dioxanotrophicus]